MTLEITQNRQIILDTETTGMNEFGAHYEGHCIIEIGAVEMINRRYTGRKLHLYIKPDRPIDPEATKVHGITDEKLMNEPDFSAIAQEFIDFIKGAELIIHNAHFDIGFIDYEFKKHNFNINTADICLITDTLQMARQMYPGKRNSLDALCDRLNIDNSKRTLHGALLDAEILGDVYLAMTGGQTSLFDEEEHTQVIAVKENIQQHIINNTHHFKLLFPTEEEKLAHQDYLKLLNQKSKENCLWFKRNTKETMH